MTVIRPRPIPPSRKGTAEEEAARAADLQERVEQARAEAEEAWARKAKLLAMMPDPGLRDVDAAVMCPCTCHPRPADLLLHAGGSQCNCQSTPAQRADALRELTSMLSEMAHDEEEADRLDRQAADRVAEELGARLTSAGGMAPFVVRGIVDGRAFCLRERHDRYQVYAAPDDDPMRDPWEGATWEGILVVASGTSDDLLDEDGRLDHGGAVRLAVEAVRVSLRRRECAHLRSSDEDWFCRDCGNLLRTAAP